MDDRCQIGALSVTTSPIGSDVESWTWGFEMPCGLEMLPGDSAGTEWRNGAMTIVNADAKLRLPHGTAVSELSRVRITSRHGTAMSLEYEVEGEPSIGVSGVICYLRRVTT